MSIYTPINAPLLFRDLEVKDQIALLKSGCTEVMFIKANYTYDIEKKALSLGPKISYTRESFLQGIGRKNFLYTLAQY